MEPPVSPENPFWPNAVIPAEFVLEYHIVPHSQPFSSSFPGIIAPKWNENADFDPIGDFAWTELDSVSRTNPANLTLKFLTQVLEAKWNAYWMIGIPYFSKNQDYHWVKVTPEIAAMALIDLQNNVNSAEIGRIFMYAESLSFFCSLNSCGHDNLIWSNVPIQKDSAVIHWPEWVKIIFRRHSDTNLYLDLWGDLDYLSFLQFSEYPWTNYVISVFWRGNPDEMEKLAVTLHLIEHAPGKDDYWNDNALALYDNLARYFYADDPESWTDRLWEYMDPLGICMDMSATEFIEMSEARRLKRDALLIEELRHKGRLWREKPRVKGFSTW